MASTVVVICAPSFNPLYHHADTVHCTGDLSKSLACLAWHCKDADSRAFLLVAVEDFDEEMARTRQTAKCMALLDERAQQTQTVPLEEVKRQLGLEE